VELESDRRPLTPASHRDRGKNRVGTPSCRRSVTKVSTASPRAGHLAACTQASPLQGVASSAPTQLAKCDPWVFDEGGDGDKTPPSVTAPL
jgi:hypothetical protein